MVGALSEMRLFTDHWDHDELPSDLEGLLATEERAVHSQHDPSRHLSALTHTLSPSPSGVLDWVLRTGWAVREVRLADVLPVRPQGTL